MLAVLDQTVLLPQAHGQDHVRVADVIEVDAIDARVIGDTIHDAAQVLAHAGPRGAEPLVVADVRRPLEARHALSAHGEPLGVVRLGPLVAAAVESPDPAVELEPLAVRRV